jgi:hypothetical protein
VHREALPSILRSTLLARGRHTNGVSKREKRRRKRGRLVTFSKSDICYWSECVFPKGCRPHYTKREKCRARHFFQNRKFTISEAAYYVGFVDQSHLTRHFNRVFGLPPKALTIDYDIFESHSRTAETSRSLGTAHDVRVCHARHRGDAGNHGARRLR